MNTAAMSPATTTLLTNLAVTLAAMIALWRVSLRRQDASIVDPFWGFGFVLVAWLSVSLNQPTSPRRWLLVTLVSLWGLRLSAYLLVRNWGHGEDRRYAAMRRHHGAAFGRVSLWTVFLLQGGLLWLISLPIQATAWTASSTSLGWLDLLGIGVWSVGWFFEMVGDAQLARFQRDANNAGKVMDRGLWRYTRHPNYFGDFCVWWGFYLIAAAGGAAWTIASPLLMSFFLLRVSGVSLLESTITQRRPQYAAYQARTNAFFPGPPRKTPASTLRQTP